MLQNEKIFASLICLCFFVSCEITEYPVESYEITNAVDGTYTLEIYRYSTN